MEAANPDNMRDFGPLDLSGFKDWALTNGGPRVRLEDGTFATDRARIRASTVEQDVRILRQFGLTLQREVRKRERRELGDVAGGEAEINFALPYFQMEMEQRELAPATQERYLVAIRRYLRYLTHRQVPVGRILGPKRPSKSSSLLHPDDLTRWLDFIADYDQRLHIATWLALAKVPVGRIAGITFGREILIDGDEVKLKIDQVELPPVPETLRSLLLAAAAAAGGGRRGEPLFPSNTPRKAGSRMKSAARLPPTQRPRLTVSGLGHLWAAARKQLDPIGPTLSQVAVVGRNVLLKREGKGWVYVPRPDPLAIRILPSQAGKGS